MGSALADLQHLSLECREAIARRLPASAQNATAIAMRRDFERDLMDRFERLMARVPIRRIVAAYMAKEPGSLSAEERETAAREIATDFEKQLTSIVSSGETPTQQALARHIARGYMQGATQVEDALRRGMFRESIREEEIEEAFDRPMPAQVIGWADKYSAQLVTRIDDTTRDAMRNTISRTLQAEYRGPSNMTDALAREFTFLSRSRAELIARTEMNFAVSAGSLERAAAAGSTQKVWVTVGDDRVSTEICLPNEAEGRIAITDAFPSGDLCPPGHPRCRCSCAYFGFTKDSVARALGGVGSDGADGPGGNEGQKSWLSMIGSIIGNLGAVKKLMAGA